MNVRKITILISGAGIAGLALAYWLRRFGFSPTLIERAPFLRSGGYKIDIRGAGLEVVKRMGIYNTIYEARTDMQGASVVDKEGKPLIEMSGDTFNFRLSEDVEIMRGDLCHILQQQIEGVESLFGDSIKTLSQDSEGVHVTFEQNPPRTFDLVIGADGLHSNVRDLVFGPESRFAEELGLYISIFAVPNHLKLDRWEIEYLESGKLVNLYSSRGDLNAKAALLFPSEPLPYDLRNIEQQKELLSAIYADLGWEVPKLLAALKESSDFYFDSVTQIHMDCWSKGKVALIGDAGYCASPVSGQGTSLAFVGAYVLAGELAAACGNPSIAFACYEKQLRKFVEKNQKWGRNFAKNMTQGNKNKITVWLHEQLMSLVPGRWIEFMAERATKKVSQAANAISLKDYP